MKEYSIEYSMFVHPAQTQEATFYFTVEATSDVAIRAIAPGLFPDWRVTSITASEAGSVTRSVWNSWSDDE